MKTAIAIFGLLYSTLAFCHPAKEETDYLIVFGGCFEKDLISLKINNVSIFDNYKIGNENSERKGNLSIKQSANFIHLFYNGQQQAKSKIDFRFYLNIEVVLNGRVNKFKLDLRKGKVVVFEKCTIVSNTAQKKLSVEQIQDQILLM